jgi:hypothetical protein
VSAAGTAADPRALGERLETLLAELPAIPDRAARERCAELARLLMEFYGSGLARVVEIARGLPQDGATLVRRLADDPQVASLLLLHGLHPLDTAARVALAVDDVRRQPSFRGQTVALAGVEGGVARVRIGGGGCSGTAEALREALVGAIEEAAPELARVEVDDAAPLIQLQIRRAP